MTANPHDVEAYAKLIRLAFQRLRAAGESLHPDAPVNLSQRAILEWLHDHGAHTVPKIAEAKSVSRQHVQKVADELVALGYAGFSPNPDHKRSPFLSLSRKGAALFAAMRKREAALISAIAAGCDGEELRQASEGLARFLDVLAEIQSTGHTSNDQ